MLYLAKLLGTTADKLLSGGSPVMQKSRRVSLSDEKEGLFALSGANFYFGEIVLLPLRGMGDYARRIRDCLGEIADDAALPRRPLPLS